MEITILTGNTGKLKEFEEIFKKRNLPVIFKNIKVDLEEIQAKTSEEVSLHKLKKVIDGKILDPNGFYIVDDTALTEINGFLPGPFIKFYDYGNGFEPLVNQFGGKEMIASVVITSCNKGVYRQFIGNMQCIVVTNKGDDVPRGMNGFGWDKYVNAGKSELEIIGKDGNITLAELGSEEKNKISHRKRAIDKFCDYVSTLV